MRSGHRDRVQSNPHDDVSLSALIHFLDSADKFLASNAAACLRQLAEGGKNKREIVPIIGGRVVPALVAHIEDVGRETTNSLREYGRLVLPYKRQLIAAIQKHPTADTGWFAAEALANLGPDAKDALPAIEAMPIYDTNRRLMRDLIAKINAPVMPNQLPDPTSSSVTPPAGAGGAPSGAADH
jgi:hypothetical protein